MGFSPVICEAAIRQVKSQDLSVLLDWVSNHGEEEEKWSKWLEDNKGK